MTDYGRCVTHHHACDCREEKFREIEEQLRLERVAHERYRELTRSNIAEQAWKQDNDRLRAQLAKAKAVIEHYQDCPHGVIPCGCNRLARAYLAETTKGGGE